MKIDYTGPHRRSTSFVRPVIHNALTSAALERLGVYLKERLVIAGVFAAMLIPRPPVGGLMDCQVFRNCDWPPSMLSEFQATSPILTQFIL